MVLIESDQALFRGSYLMPRELWSRKEKKWVPYKGSVPKEPGWGDIVTEKEAEEIKADF